MTVRSRREAQIAATQASAGAAGRKSATVANSCAASRLDDRYRCDGEEAHRPGIHNEFSTVPAARSAQGSRLLAITAAGAKALPASASTHSLYGYALLDAARYLEAVAEFEAYGRMAPREPGPLDSLGDAYLAMGDGERALGSYSGARSIDPRYSHNGRA